MHTWSGHNIDNIGWYHRVTWGGGGQGSMLAPVNAQRLCLPGSTHISTESSPLAAN